MRELINIDGQQFYYSTIEGLRNKDTKQGGCTLVVNVADVKGLPSGVPFDECVNQLIVVGKNVNEAVKQVEGKDMLLLSATDIQEAIRFAVLGEALSQNIICVSKKTKKELKEIIELVVVN